MIIRVRAISPKRMVLDFRPVTVWAYWAFGLLFAACGALAALFLATSTSFRCTRLDGTCRLDHASPLGRDEQRIFQLADLRGGTVATHSNLLTNSMVLIAMSRTGDIAIPLAAASGPQKDSLALELSQFATDPQNFAFEVHEDGRLSGYLFGAALLVAGLVCLAAVERVRLILDRGPGTLQLKTRRYFRSRRKTLRLARVKGVTALEHRYRKTAIWSVTIMLDGGAELPLTRLPLFTAISAEQTRQLVKRWLA